ncbi:hypothetical protein BU14_0442s0006 [Porphyra umbilicalis]|uniref:Uncharacterized protein n=1 Tax=Porphyra umbilicalis TaxID=2786 RepID=A0A1X6NUU4_PORUM|nr:hypothetical protein BU14_0442s0006 [Porphyra umbilicalis]|eukprot:OSX72371.1 hypothetical protein BU14_0442s0006 [Porphyra umbilicalis]
MSSAASCRARQRRATEGSHPPRSPASPPPPPRWRPRRVVGGTAPSRSGCCADGGCLRACWGPTSSAQRRRARRCRRQRLCPTGAPPHRLRSRPRPARSPRLGPQREQRRCQHARHIPPLVYWGGGDLTKVPGHVQRPRPPAGPALGSRGVARRGGSKRVARPAPLPAPLHRNGRAADGTSTRDETRTRGGGGRAWNTGAAPAGASEAGTGTAREEPAVGGWATEKGGEGPMRPLRGSRPSSRQYRVWRW